MTSDINKIVKVLNNYINVYDRRDQLSKNEIEMIENYTRKQPQITKTLYRGQPVTRKIIESSEWFSLSENEFMVKERFSTEGKCCVFKVHVINTPAIDIQEFSRKYDLEVHEDENEFIVIGDGRFFQDEKMSIPGFNEVKYGEYETWYTTMSDDEIKDYNSKNQAPTSVSNLKPKDIDDFLKEIKDDGMLEMIDNQDELKELFPSEISNLSQEQINDLMGKINHENNKNAGKDKNKKSNKRNNKKSRIRQKTNKSKNKKSTIHRKTSKRKKKKSNNKSRVKL